MLWKWPCASNPASLRRRYLMQLETKEYQCVIV